MATKKKQQEDERLIVKRLRQEQERIMGELQAASARIRYLERQLEKKLRGQDVTILPPRKTLGPRDVPHARRVLKKEGYEILDGRIETRIRSDFLFLRAKETPCNANGFLRARDLLPLRTAILACSRAYKDSAFTGLQGSAGKPWEGVVTTNGACALDIGNFLEEFARAPYPRIIAQWVRAIASAMQIQIAGEVTVSYRRVYSVKNRLGNTVGKVFAVRGRPDKRFVIGDRIKSPEEMGVQKRLVEEGGAGLDFDE